MPWTSFLHAGLWAGGVPLPPSLILSVAVPAGQVQSLWGSWDEDGGSKRAEQGLAWAHIHTHTALQMSALRQAPGTPVLTGLLAISTPVYPQGEPGRVCGLHTTASSPLPLLQRAGAAQSSVWLTLTSGV